VESSPPILPTTTKIIEITDADGAQGLDEKDKIDPFKIISESSAEKEKKDKKKDKFPPSEPKEMVREEKREAKEPAGVFYGDVQEKKETLRVGEQSQPTSSNEPLTIAPTQQPTQPTQQPTQPAQQPAQQSAQQSPASSPSKSKVPPKNYIEFEREWRKAKGNDEAMYDLLKCMKSESLQTVLQESLTGEILGKMLTAVCTKMAEYESVMPPST